MFKVRLKTALVPPKSNSSDMAKVTMMVAPWEKAEMEREISTPHQRKAAPKQKRSSSR